MASSTSRSSASIPTFAVLLLAVALAALGLSAFYTLRLNAELNYFLAADRLQSAWAEKMTRDAGAKLVIYGGSSCLFGIDAERLLHTHQMPAVNLGRGAGMGASVLTLAALQHTRPGDTLVAALEPSLLNGSLEPPSLGVQFSVVAGHTEWVRHPAVGTNVVVVALSLAEPPSWRLSCIDRVGQAGRRQAGFPLLRQRHAPRRFRPDSGAAADQGPSPHSGVVSEDARSFLAALRDWSREHHVRVAYTLPWSFSPPDRAKAYQRLNAGLLFSIAEFLPVLRDPRLGAYTVREHFADTELHLTAEGADLRTDELAELIKHWRVWTSEELSHGATPDGALARENNRVILDLPVNSPPHAAPGDGDRNAGGEWSRVLA